MNVGSVVIVGLAVLAVVLFVFVAALCNTEEHR